ncbi:MAG: hypothetical protein JWN34_1716 [Bryobacterales bacterium]|jgi:hypothetical protein|nr:hypothetical protein [Bryobacterales bacterium]
MPCPLFVPETVIAGSTAAFPLGAVFHGSCAAHVVADDGLLQRCNTGYARQVCPQAAEIQTDAVRFRIRGHAAGVIEIAWSTERDHHPVAVGVLSLEKATDKPGTLEQQARACAGVYLQNTGLAW